MSQAQVDKKPFVRCATVGSDLHVIAASVNEDDPLSHRIHHNIRYATSWQGWGHTGYRWVGDASCAGMGDDLHIILVTPINSAPHVGHLIRSPGSWRQKLDIRYSGTELLSVSCAPVGGDLHVVVVTDNGKLFHNIRYATSWQGWGGPIADSLHGVSCAGMGGDLHIVALGSHGEILHNIRFAGPPARWQGWGHVGPMPTSEP
jgi:hypothetical protein